MSRREKEGTELMKERRKRLAGRKTEDVRKRKCWQCGTMTKDTWSPSPICILDVDVHPLGSSEQLWNAQRRETQRRRGQRKRRITNSLQKQSKLQNPLINLFSPCAYSHVSFPAGRGDSDTFLYLRALRNRKLFQKQQKTTRGQGEVTR